MPVHLYGQMADMRAFRRLADDRGIELVEDACQAHGAERDGLRAGAVGNTAAFSFYPGKNLGAAGDAGALVTSDAETDALVRALREHGQTAKYVHAHEGFTARLDALQAVVLSHKLPLLDDWNEQRRAGRGLLCKRARRRGRPCSPPGRTRQRSSLAPLRRADRRAGPARRVPPRARHRDRAALSRSSSLDRCLRLAWPRARRLSCCRGPREARPLAADLPGHYRRAARGGRQRSPCLLRWLTRPQTMRHIA